tara:strand:- start:44 stop:397 length:354 start_codon:yes stop_codon:yes gene_type:complete
MKGKYLIIKNLNRFLCTGDMIFTGGCGKFMEGTPDQMMNCMNLARSLPQDTIMLPGHEYTMANLDFCAKAEGRSNPKIAEYKSIFKARLDSGFPSIPSTLGEEKLYNVFMRTNEKSL